MCQDILDLELWDLALPPSLGHPGMSPDIPGYLGLGTLGLNTASRSGTSWDVLVYPWTWDILGCPWIS